ESNSTASPNICRRFPPPWSIEVTPNCTNSMPAPMPTTCDGGDNDGCDQHNEDDSRDIFHNALRAGNIGPIWFGELDADLNGDTTHRAYRISTQSPGHLLAGGSPSLETRSARGIRGREFSPIRVTSEPARQTCSCLSPQRPGSSAHRQWQFG